ncbi:myelin-oligodendrocyte glycoprotein-like isoform X2 [Numida meleagris]|uniref:myelin-oligodendrocyte glycoprotein-like isoform X2 n=1 Tax=Numida meleagris TaxID=8996 RepID=UPI000B3DE943|nr:myelin-oligodendrocyte glycoprotein-like isoform X2 [Numida meleagris]
MGFGCNLDPLQTDPGMRFGSGCNHPRSALPWRSLLPHLLALLLLHPGSAQIRVVAPRLPVTAVVGQDVVLRCHLSPCKNASSLDIRWSRNRSAEIVHHYQNGVDREQMEEYKGRTELLREGLSDGNLDLRITAVTSSDSGSYRCIVEDGADSAEAVVNLEVSDPCSQIVYPCRLSLAVALTLLLVISVFLIIMAVAECGVHWPLPRTKRFGVWAWEQSWDEKLSPLTMHFLCFYFAEGINGKLAVQAITSVKQTEALGESSSPNQWNVGFPMG